MERNNIFFYYIFSYCNSFLEKINSVTKEDVRNASEKYFLANNTRVFVTGKGSEILDALEGLEYNGEELSIRYFDKFGNETSKPNYTVSADVSAESIVSNYINSIGGRDRLEEVGIVIEDGNESGWRWKNS